MAYSSVARTVSFRVLLVIFPLLYVIYLSVYSCILADIYISVHRSAEASRKRRRNSLFSGKTHTQDSVIFVHEVLFEADAATGSRLHDALRHNKDPVSL
jgi:hypothetical protein